jgi:hypothetical protein
MKICSSWRESGAAFSLSPGRRNELSSSGDIGQLTGHTSAFRPTMKPSRFLPAGTLLAALCLNFLAVGLTAAPTKETVLIDFTDVRRERDDSVLKNYEYDFGDWSKHLTDLPRRGCLVQSPTGKGGLGENKTMVEFHKTSLLLLVFVLGNNNQARSLNFHLEDSDGTEQAWNLSFDGLAKGVEQHFPIDLAKCTSESKPGKKPGLDLKKIASWQITGDWSDPGTEVLLIKLVAPAKK